MAHALTVYLLLCCLNTVTEANSTPHPRMVFTDKETTFKRSPSPVHQAPVRLLLRNQPDMVTAVGQSHLNFYNFKKAQENPVERKVEWTECRDTDCDYRMTVVHQRENSSLMFVCGTNGTETLCCDMDVSGPSLSCTPREKMRGIKESIEGFIDKESEHSVLVEFEQSADLFMAYSGSQDRVGIYKFGSRRVMPATHDEEQHYAGLVLSRRKDTPLQDRVYAFYKQKNRDAVLDGEMWISFVSQVCMSDVGGPKNRLQLRWTSKLNARLFCGDHERRQIFSELVDTATVHAEHWEDTRIYGLFRNEWGMSAVCVYTIRDIDNVFMTSSFKGQSPETTANRPRNCVSDSSKFTSDVLEMIDKTSEMEGWVQPVDQSDPLLFSHHKYTHICVDSSQQKGGANAVMFLSLNNGRIHKAAENENKTFIIAEYRPFHQTDHIENLILHTSSKKLYVNTRHEVVQVDVVDCGRYGNSCQDCILSRDPYCGWKDGLCTSETHNSLQDVAEGDPTVCKEAHGLVHGLKAFRRSENTVSVPFQSKHFLSCPVSSHHAQYTWRSGDQITVCSSREEQCVHLIHSMSPELEGIYACTSDEQGYHKVLAQYQLRVHGRAANQQSGPVLWVCLVLVLMKAFSC